MQQADLALQEKDKTAKAADEDSELVGMAMWKVAVQIGLSLGPGENKTSLVGLLGGYPLTRLFLQPAFNVASELEHSAGGP